MASMEDKENPKNVDIANVYDESHSCQTPGDCAAYYDKWSNTYDNFVKIEEFRGAELLAEVVFAHLEPLLGKPTVDILDIGVGTGKVGRLLIESVKEKHGVEAAKKINIDGVDGSAGMLEKLSKHEPMVYRRLYQEILLVDQPSSFLAPESFDIVMGVGLFSPGHMTADHILHLIVPAKKGGLIIFGVRDMWLEKLDMERKLNDLEAAGTWRLIKRSSKAGYRRHVPGIFFVYERL